MDGFFPRGLNLLMKLDVFIFQASFYSQDGKKRVIDPIVQATCSQESLSIVISIMIKCISLESCSRPSIEDILWNLQYAAQIQATAGDGDHSLDAAAHQ